MKVKAFRTQDKICILAGSLAEEQLLEGELGIDLEHLSFLHSLLIRAPCCKFYRVFLLLTGTAHLIFDSASLQCALSHSLE